MFNIGSNQVLLLAFLLLLIGVGTYLTYFHQQDTLTSLNREIEAKEQKQKKIQALRDELRQAKNAFADVEARWNRRYKQIPDSIASPDVIEYLTNLTQTGFRTFNVVAPGPEQRDGYSAHVINAEGKAFFTSLYRLIWRLENSRPFYRVNDLQLSYLEERTTDEETEHTRMDVLVSFQFDIEALYGIVDEPPSSSDQAELDSRLATRRAVSPPVPEKVLPNSTPQVNPFYPLVFEEIPPNEEGRLNVENAHLISIVGGKAIFSSEGNIVRLSEGDRVYLGRITEIDATDGRVAARLNKGGIVETIERRLNLESPLQQTGPRPASTP